MSNYTTGTVVRVDSVNSSLIPSDYRGKSFHLDADRVWRATDGSGAERDDFELDTALRGSYVTLTDVTSDYAPYLSQATSTPAPETAPSGVVITTSTTLGELLSQVASTGTPSDSVVAVFEEVNASVQNAATELRSAFAKLESAYAAGVTQISEALRG